VPDIVAHRAVVRARNGLIATAHPLASAAGLEALMAGGTAVDAALAASAVLNITLPYLNHLGGDLFLQYYSAKERRVTAINGSGAAPASARPEGFPQGIPLRGLNAITVPGQVHAWFEAHKRWGRLPVARLLARAIEYATDGFAIGPGLAKAMALHAEWMRHFPTTSAQFLNKGRPYQVGEILRQPNAARTLAAVGKDGPDAFYKGPVARAMADFCRENAGLMSAEDLAGHRSRVLEPVKGSYRGLTVYEQPPPSQGFIVPAVLQILERFDLKAMGFGSVDALHVQIEALQAVFSDRSRYLGEPEGRPQVEAAVRRLLSGAYAAGRARRIDMKKAGRYEPTEPGGGETTYLCAVDREGNAVSWIQSVFHHWGCGVVLGDTGVLPNNRMNGFVMTPGHVNAPAPGKRPLHTLNTYIACRGDAFAIAGGTPGGHSQVQTNVQVLCDLIDFGMNPQQAAEAPRFVIGDSTDPTQTDAVRLEPALGQRAATELAARGHQASAPADYTAGGAVQLIVRDEKTGVYSGGSDHRAEGHAAGW
jgi:gamma-glutamyltranspeptidase/glutathione hydrolase